MKHLKILTTYSCFILLVSMVFLQCTSGTNQSASEDARQEEMDIKSTGDMEEGKSMVMVQAIERLQLEGKHKAKAPLATTEPGRYEEEIISQEDVFVAPLKDEEKVVVVVPHRTVFVPAPIKEEMIKPETSPVELTRQLNQFDTPPMYAYDECADNRHPQHCMHVRLQRFFRNNINLNVHPEASADHVEYAHFVVKADGNVDPESIRIIDQNPHCARCAEETKRLVKMLNAWKPGTWNGENVDVEVTLPVRFHDFEI